MKEKNTIGFYINLIQLQHTPFGRYDVDKDYRRYLEEVGQCTDVDKSLIQRREQQHYYRWLLQMYCNLHLAIEVANYLTTRNEAPMIWVAL